MSYVRARRQVASSIPATEHSVMTSWPTEEEVSACVYILCSPFAEAMVDCPESEIDKELVAGDAQWNGALRGGGLRLRHGLVRLRKCPQQRSPQVLNLASVSPYDHRFGVWNTCMSRFDWGSVSQIDLVQGGGEEEGEGRPDCAAARLGRPRRAGISIPKELCWELYPFYFKFRLVCMRVGCDWLCMSVIGFVWEGKYSDADWTNQKLHRSSRGSRLLTRSLVAAKTSASERVASQTPDVQLSWLGDASGGMVIRWWFATILVITAAHSSVLTLWNRKGFKVINGAAVIQGDGINYDVVKNILDAVRAITDSCQLGDAVTSPGRTLKILKIVAVKTN